MTKPDFKSPGECARHVKNCKHRRQKSKTHTGDIHKTSSKVTLIVIQAQNNVIFFPMLSNSEKLIEN